MWSRRRGIRAAGAMIFVLLVTLLPLSMPASGTSQGLSHPQAGAAQLASPQDDGNDSGTDQATSSSSASSTSAHTGNWTRSSSSTGGGGDDGQSSTSTYTATGSGGGSGDSGGSQGLEFQMVAASGSGTGAASLTVSGGSLFVRIELENMAQHSRYTVFLVVNGTNDMLGNFTTDEEGQAQIRAGYTLPAGSYAVGISVTLPGVPAGTPVMTSQPAAQPLKVTDQPQQTSSQSVTTQSQSVTTIHAQSGQEDDIQSAIQNKVIPVVIGVGAGGVNYTVLDSNFTLFVGAIQSGGLQITISAMNGTSPRVLLVNLTSPQTVNLQPSSLAITFDGAPVQQAASVAGVISPQPGSPPLFVLISTAGGYQLLILIPHFSTHVIQIIPAVVKEIASLWGLDGPLAALSLLVATSAFLVVYARRVRLPS